MNDSELASALQGLLGSQRVLFQADSKRAYDCDAYSIEKSEPSLIVLPESTEDVQKIVQWCSANNIPYTPRGAGTGLSGGSLAAKHGVLISTKKLTKIIEIDVANRCLKAQAGIANKRISDAVSEFGLHFAPDPSSQTVSTLGGNIAENSGGPHTLKYGVTVQHVLGVTIVAPDGEIVVFGGKVPGGPGYDFLSIIVGSEGTLGIVTEAWVKLTPLPKAIKTALISFRTVRDASEAVSAIIASGVLPAALEFMDSGILKALNAAFGLEYPEGTNSLLLVECDSDSPDEAIAIVEREMARVTQICNSQNAIEVRIARDDAERQQLWTARKKGIGAMGRLAPTIVTHDGVIPRSKLPEMLDLVYEVADRYQIGVANLFHAGDGNLHPCFYFDDRDPKQIEAVIQAGEDIMKRCIELGGSITGEHGIGVEKLDLMKLQFSEDDLKAQAMIKRIFNEGELCNPCKVIPNQKGCVEHQRRWRGAAW
jgi:glycolate oxidase